MQLEFTTESPDDLNTVCVKAPHLGFYTDYRKYLKDFYAYKVKTESSPFRNYSYGNFSASADIKSPNYLKMIIEGQRNLSPKTILKFAKALQLNKEQTKEFQVLVNYGQAKNAQERNHYLKTLSELRVTKQVKDGKIKASAMNKVSSWLSLALFALADQEGVDFTPTKLRETLRGRASLEEINKALSQLFENGELVRNPETGAVEKGRRLMQNAGEIPAALVRRLQAEFIYMGMESLFEDSPQERELGAFTLALTEEEFGQVKFEVRQLRKRLYKTLLVNREQTKGKRVYQLNFQVFPLTDSVTGKQTFSP